MRQSVIYLRVSGDGQIAGDGFPRQRDACARFAAERAIEIVAEFRDEGVTGKMELENREQLSACIAYVQEHQIGLVLVEDSTRLARDLIVAEVCIREFQKLGVTVMAASGGLNLTEGDDANPTAKLVRQILAAISEFERCCIVIRLRAARQRIKARQNKCEGRKGFGEKPGEARALEQIAAWAATGSTAEKIAASLNACQYPSRSGKPWRRTTVAKIVRRLKAQGFHFGAPAEAA